MKIEELATATIIKIYSLLYYITIFRRKKNEEKIVPENVCDAKGPETVHRS